MVIGIPRSLFYYYFFPFWSGVFQALGLTYLVSPETTKSIMEAGVALSADEICLPVKLHFGQVHYLAEQVDLIFSPGFGRWGRRSHFCPKLIGLPDLVRLRFDRTLVFHHELDEADRLAREYWLAPLQKLAPGVKRRTIIAAWKEGERKQAAFIGLCRKGYLPPQAIKELDPCSFQGEDGLLKAGNNRGKRPRILVLGHPYMVYDNLAGQGLLQTLAKAGAEIVTKEMIPVAEEERLWPTQEKRVFWTLGQQMLSAAYYFVSERLIDGIIFHTACLCGPDALIGDLLEKYLSRIEEAPPLLKLTVDEHTGYAGLQTRVEAFLDLLEWRKQYAAV
jgi:predicted nucleotide-binding protein (sugar kinase/HSP70/actin superfamily)